MSGTFQGRLAYASCAVNAGPPGVVTFNSQSGDFDEAPTTPIYTAVGIYLLALSNPIDPTDATFSVTCRDVAGRPAFATIDDALTTATEIGINVYDDGGAPFDPSGFDITIVVRPSN